MSFLTGGGKATFERLLDSATSQMLLEPSWVTNLELCDCIRQQDVTPKFALVALQKRMRDPNPHVSKFALIVLETCVKNCGAPFHEEMANNEFMDDLRTLVQTGSAPVKEQVLTMLQAWNHAFRNKTQFQPILATYNLMRMEGHKFPPLNESDAMFSADAAPSWKDGDVCHLCRVKFGTFTRQHHCRACGECFCSKCSSKSSIIPKMGIEREVRVCDTCFDELNPNAGKEQARKVEVGDNDLPAEYLNSDLAKEQQTKPTLSEDDVKAQEEEELQLAMAISLSEEESKLGPKKNWSMPAAPVSETIKPPEPKAPEPKSTLFSGVAASLQSVAEDSAAADLNKYLDRNYWEKKNAELKSREQPSAPAAALPPVSQPPPVVNYSSDEGSDENVESSAGAEVFINTMSKSIEMFTDRMNNVRSKGKHIAMDTTVQSLFQSLSAMHPQLMKLIEDEEESKVKYDAMLQKLAVIREARESLNDMRTQYTEKFQQQELEQEMLRRMQMEQKLELMRQQKQEYLEYQRQLQIQRQQELEHFQLEKLRQKQMFGINGAPVIPDYPEVPTHAPGSIVLPGSYKPQPQAVHYGAEMALQNPKIAVAAAVRVPQAESLPAESYHGMDRPPQYPGSPRHFVRPEAQELPPSYATATEGGVTSNPEYYSHNGEPIASSQWQQQTLPPVRPATHPNQPFQQQSPHGSLTHIQQDGGQQPGQQQQSFNQQQPGQQMPPQISQPQAHPIQQQQQQQHQHPGLPPQTSIPQHMPPATSIQQHHHQQQPQQFHQQAGGGPPPPPIHSSQSQQQMPPQQQQQPPPQMQQPQMGHQQPQPQQSHSQQLPPQQMPPPPAHQQMQPPPQQQMQQTSQQQGGQPMQQPQQQMQPQQQQSQQQMQPQYQQQQQQQQQPGQMQYYDQSMQQQQPSMSQPNEPQQQYGMNQQQQQQPLPQQQMYQQQQPQQQPQQFAQLPPQQQQHQQQQQQVDNLSSNMKDLQLISFD